MTTMALDIHEDQWAALQNHTRSSNPDDGSFYTLLSALDAGWHIEQPVYARPRWGNAHVGQQIYHFMLRRGKVATMVKVPDGPRLHAFLDEQQISVNRQAK